MEFVPGVRFSGDFHAAVVKPLLDRHFPRVTYAAALLGWGSDVLGFDTERSTDHNWGPRLQLFVDDFTDNGAAIDSMLTSELPGTWRGFPTAFPLTMDDRTRHRVEVVELGGWLSARLGFDPRAGIGTHDWLATPTQLIAEVTGGAVHHDDSGELSAVRTALSWYPDDVWRYVLACQWHRIAQEEAFPGRCAEVGDELGSAVVTARLVRDIMRLCLLLHRRYPLYAKWLGSAFARLPLGDLPAHLADALAAQDWRTRQDALVAAYRAVAVLHNETGLTEPLSTDVEPYYGRPFLVLHADRFADALMATVPDEAVLALPPRGAVDQFVDSTDTLCDPGFTRTLQWA